MKEVDKNTYIEEEVFVVLHSGEIPEVTLYEALYHLTEDPDGPGLALSDADVLPLKEAVVERYRAIILRDLEPANRDKTMYRGLARCAANWQRLLKFCAREDMETEKIRAETAEALQKFFGQEVADARSGAHSSSLNCSESAIEELAESLGLSPGALPEGWQELCPALETGSYSKK